MQEILHT
nr:unnamed protein product [Callosobruchus chinensis]